MSQLTKPFPYVKFAHKGYDLNTFEWELADDAAIVFESELEFDDLTSAVLLADGYKQQITATGEVYYEKRLGDIWVGRRLNRQKF